MDTFEILVFLMFIALLLVGSALKLSVSYPIFLVIGGCILGFIPGLGGMEYEPNLVLAIVLPPILYYAAFSIPYKELRRNLREILSLALGLVLLTTMLIGLLFKWFFPDLPYALAFAFGAIISPPDAIAATSILKRFDINSRLQAVLEGESLINDATGLVLYRIAVVALLTGTFSFADASVEFVKIVSGGILVGLCMGYFVHKFASRFFDPVLVVVNSFIIPYLTYFAADNLHFSGVLAVVVCGIIGSRLVLSHFGSLTRVVAWATWDVYIIILNCFVFILIGLQLHGVMLRLSVSQLQWYFLYALLFTLAAIVIRFMYVFIRKSFEFYRAVEGCSSHKHVFRDAVIISWSGMRGIVSLTAALALPKITTRGESLPGYDAVLFMTFIVIFLSLIIPGLTLAKILTFLHVEPCNDYQDTKAIRKQLLASAQEEITHLFQHKKISDFEMEFLSTYFKSRHRILEIASKGSDAHALNNARLNVIARKRKHLLSMWEGNQIDDKLFNSLEHELDLEESYVIRAEI